LPDGHVGRMAVLPEWRGKGVGTALLSHLIEDAREQGMNQLVLNAQTSACDFYRRFHFEAEGEEFIEAGIPHVRMTRTLAA
jgi:predicted GNAT family N-acyltransferase